MTQHSAKTRMSSSLSLPLNAAAHPDDAVSGLKVSLAKPTSSANRSGSNIQKVEAFTEPSIKTNNVALSFAYDIATKSLHVVMTDKTSGEVVREMSYTHFPTGTHQTEQLHGLLLDQMA
jgi:uncharacterized FlaG/YvyC family protein